MSNNQIGRALSQFVAQRAAPNVKHKYGFLGDAAGVIDVSGRDGFVYVRLATASELMQVLNGGRVATTSEMAGVPVIIGFDAAQQLWRIIDIARDHTGTVNTITTSDVTGTPQTVSANTYQPGSPVGRANTIVMMSPAGTSTTNISNVYYNNNTVYITQSGVDINLLTDQLAKRRSWIGL